MRRKRDDGVCLAYSKSDGLAIALPRSEYPRLKTDWMAGRAFWVGTGFHGGTLVLKLGDIVAIHDAPPQTMTDDLAERRANEHDDKQAEEFGR